MKKRYWKWIITGVIVIISGVVITWLHLWLAVKMFVGLLLFGIPCIIILDWMKSIK